MAVDTGFNVNGEKLLLSKTEALLLDLLAEYHFNEDRPLILLPDYDKAIDNLWLKGLVYYEVTPYDEFAVTMTDLAIDLYTDFGYYSKNREDTWDSSIVEVLSNIAIEISLLRDEIRKLKE